MTVAEPTHPPAPAVVRLYRAAAILWLTTSLLFLFANAIAWRLLPDPEQARQLGGPTPVDAERFRTFFPALGEAEVATLLRESALAIQYEPFTQFREKPTRGRFVNVEQAGFRIGTDQGPWPPDPAFTTIFLFGGSTTFGYGVPDDATIGSHLQAELAHLGLRRPPRVYNFGRGAYYSSQERVLFEKLALAGIVPDVAVFVDGLNDFFMADDLPILTPWLTMLVASGGQPPPALHAIVDALPAIQLLRRTLRPATEQGYPAPPPGAQAKARYDDPAVLTGVIERYRRNMRLTASTARELGVTRLFVWQPVPTYAYEPAAPHPYALGRHETSQFGYPLVATEHANGRMGADFAWCADTQAGLAAAYVDQVHYTPEMSQRIAACIAAALRPRLTALRSAIGVPGAGPIC